MTRLLFIVLLCLGAYMAPAQKAALKDGRLMVNDSVFCLYETDNYEYPSYSFSTKNAEQIIFATAYDLSSAGELYLVHYYKISFPLLGEELAIRYHPYRMQTFADDLVKYHVFRNGYWNASGAVALLKAWHKKLGLLSAEEIAGGTSIPSKHTDDVPTQDVLLEGISFRDDKIYRDDTVIGSYRVEKQPVKNGVFQRGQAFYEIYGPTGNRLARITAPQRRSVAYMKITGEERSLQLLCPDKSDEKILRVATGVLLLQGVLQ